MTGKKQHRAYLGLGSNMGDKAGNLTSALELLAEAGVTIAAVSPFYRTAPWGNENQDWFVNACAAVETSLEPHPLLKLCLDIEHRMGRERLQKWGPRLIDIDILMFEDKTIATERLSLPHPHLLQRAFVLVPLNDIAPDIAIGKITVAQALAQLDASGVIRHE